MAKRNTLNKAPMPADDSLNSPTALELFTDSVDQSLLSLCSTLSALSLINEKHGLKMVEGQEGGDVKGVADPSTTVAKLDDIKFRLSSIAQAIKDEVELNSRL